MQLKHLKSFLAKSKEDLESLDENTFNEIFDGVPSSSIGYKELAKGINIDLRVLPRLVGSLTHIKPSIGLC